MTFAVAVRNDKCLAKTVTFMRPITCLHHALVVSDGQLQVQPGYD